MMLCEICKKEEANVHLTQIINGKVTKMHFCETCAKKKGMDRIPFPKGIHSDLLGFAFAEILEGLAEPGIRLEEENLVCTNCGLSYSDFKSTGKLGCSECYKTFKTRLIPLLKRIHGKTEHMGRVPKKELFFLQKELQEAVNKEEYERAAQIRDKINVFKRKNGS